MSKDLPCFNTAPVQRDLVVRDAADLSSRNLQEDKNKPTEDVKIRDSVTSTSSNYNHAEELMETSV